MRLFGEYVSFSFTANGHQFVFIYDVNRVERWEVIMALHDHWLANGLITWEQLDYLLYEIEGYGEEDEDEDGEVQEDVSP